MFLAEKEKMVPTLMEQCHLTRKDAEQLFMFVIHGAYQVNKSMHWEKNADWFRFQTILTKFILAGFDALQ